MAGTFIDPSQSRELNQTYRETSKQTLNRESIKHVQHHKGSFIMSYFGNRDFQPITGRLIAISCLLGKVQSSHVK